MYSRYGDNAKRPVRLPEHYGGSAFSNTPTEPFSIPKKEPARFYAKDGIGEKASPVADRLLRAEAAEETANDLSSAPPILDAPSLPKETAEEKEEQTAVPPVEKKSAIAPINFEGLRRLLGGVEGDGDKDRLLLLGLILLLSRTEGDSDILLWLSLLLLCG